MKSVISWRSEINTDRQQSRAKDRFQRFIGFEARTWECDMVAAGTVRDLTGKLHDLPPGRYYAAYVTSLRNGSPIRSRVDDTLYFTTAEERETYIATRRKAYDKKVAGV